MRLQNAEIRPGNVMKVIDNYGTVKAYVIGLFDESADPDTLPPVYPFTTFNRGTFSQPKEGDPIWVLIDRGNPQELLYVRQADISGQLADILDNSYEDVEVVMRTDSETGYAQILFDTDEGMIIENNDSGIYIKKNGDITIHKNGSHRTIEINSDGISLGSEGKSAEPALLGDKTQDALDKLWDCLNTLVIGLGSDPYAAMAVSQVTGKLPDAKMAIMKIKSDNVTLD
jgi:hypothetical protein